MSDFLFLFRSLRKYTGSAQVCADLLLFFFFWKETLWFVSLFGNKIQVWAQLRVQLKSVGYVAEGWTRQAFDSSCISPVPGENGWSVSHRPSQLWEELSQHPLGRLTCWPRGEGGFVHRARSLAEQADWSAGHWAPHSADLGYLEMQPRMPFGLSSYLTCTFLKSARSDESMSRCLGGISM